MSYQGTFDRLVERMVALGPQILAIDDAWDLFKIPQFTCSDLGPSLAQADAALSQAKHILREAETRPGG
jgi:hypothetical protein